MAEHSAIYYKVMNHPKLGRAIRESLQTDAAVRKPRILLGASGSVAAMKLGQLCSIFSDRAEIAGGLCDNLLTHIVCAWDCSKPLFVAPAMDTLMWNNPLKQNHIKAIEEHLGAQLIRPVTANGAMAEVSLIHNTERILV